MLIEFFVATFAEKLSVVEILIVIGGTGRSVAISLP
jgi:hypothetical protein